MTEEYVIEKAPEQLAKELSFIFDDFENCFIAGGIIKDFYLKHAQKDIDVFFSDEESANNAIEKANSISGYVTAYESENSSGFEFFSFDNKNFFNGALIDLVKTRYGSPQDVISTFDMTVAQAALFKKDDEFFLIKNKDYDTHIKLKKIVFDNITSNVAERIIRYLNYGFNIDDYEIQKAFAFFAKNYQEIEKIHSSHSKDFIALAQSFEDALRKTDKAEVEYSDKKLFGTGGSLSPSIGYKAERMVVRHIISDFKTPNEWKKEDFFSSLSEEFKEKIESNYPHHACMSNDYFRISIMKELIKLSANIDKTKLNNFYQYIESSQILFSRKNSVVSDNCRYCGCDVLHVNVDKDYDSRENDSLIGESQNMIAQLELVYKALDKQDSIEWKEYVIDFFLDVVEMESISLSLKEWHDFIESEAFEPSLPAHLILSLVGNK